MGMPVEHITVTELDGVVYRGRVASMDPHKEQFAHDTQMRTLKEVLAGADIFLGLSGPGVLTGALGGDHGRATDHSRAC